MIRGLVSLVKRHKNSFTTRGNYFLFAYVKIKQYLCTQIKMRSMAL